MKKVLVVIALALALSSCSIVQNMKDFQALTPAEKAKYRSMANGIYIDNRVESIGNDYLYGKDKELRIELIEK